MTFFEDVSRLETLIDREMRGKSKSMLYITDAGDVVNFVRGPGTYFPWRHVSKTEINVTPVSKKVRSSYNSYLRNLAVKSGVGGLATVGLLDMVYLLEKSYTGMPSDFAGQTISHAILGGIIAILYYGTRAGTFLMNAQRFADSFGAPELRKLYEYVNSDGRTA